MRLRLKDAILRAKLGTAQLTSLTGIHLKVMACLDELGIEYEVEKAFDKYSADIYIPSKHLSIECDGPTHNTEEGIAHDKKKDAYILKKFGVVTHRLPHLDIEKDTKRLKHILTVVYEGKIPIFSKELVVFNLQNPMRATLKRRLKKYVELEVQGTTIKFDYYGVAKEYNKLGKLVYCLNLTPSLELSIKKDAVLSRVDSFISSMDAANYIDSCMETYAKKKKN